MYYKPIHFDVKELVSESVYNRFGQDALMLLRPELLMTLDKIRERYNKSVTVNTWSFGGKLYFRGYRPFDCTVGARYSQHRLGNAADFDVDGMTADEVRADIIKYPNAIHFANITCIEANVNWVHIDCRNIKDRIRIVYP